MHAHPRSSGFNAVLIGLVGPVMAGGIAAATARVDCDRRLVRCSVTVNGNLPAQAKRAPQSFRLRELWRYSPDTQRWIDVTPRNILPVAISSSKNNQVLFELPRIIGLYRVRWTEDGQRHEGSAFVGPILCNDILLQEPPPPGSYAGCWPLARGAMAGYVTNPPPPRE